MNPAHQASMLVLVFLAAGSLAAAEPVSPEAVVQHHLGLAAVAEGRDAEASQRFEAACLADNGLGAACLEWAKLAARTGDVTTQKQALASAVMLSPQSLEARYELGLLLLSREDFTWAKEHLEAALPLAADAKDKALVLYYLGYAQLHLGQYAQAAQRLGEAAGNLPDELEARASYFRGVAAMESGDGATARQRLGEACRQGEPTYGADACLRTDALSAFADPRGFAAKLSASIGFDTHPLSDFVDSQVGDDKGAALKSVLRGDVLGGFGRRRVAGQFGLTVYRDQTYTTVGREDAPGAVKATDFNLTLVLAQAGLAVQFLTGRLEHRLKAAAEGELQLFDSLPEERAMLGEDGQPVQGWTPGEPGLGVAAVSGRLAWALALRKQASTELRLLIQLRPNYIEENRSTYRYGLQLVHSRSFLDEGLKARVATGLRYDRSFYDPAVVKFDRLLPELSLDLDWRTPIPRLSATLGGTVKHNWYLNARTNAANSFRPRWEEVADATPARNDQLEAKYYDVARSDFEWEARMEAAVALWRGAELALPYKHHQRHCNLDGAPHGPTVGQAPVYGYRQDVVSLELRQTF